MGTRLNKNHEERPGLCRRTAGRPGPFIAEFDWTVGAVMDQLERLGVADNTLLIVTSDNGPVLEDGYQDQARELLNGHSPSGNLRGNKYGVYEAGARVPALVRWPGRIAAGTQSDALVSQVDLFASLARLLGSVLPRAAAPDSRDGLDAWLGQDPVGRPYVVEQANNRTLSVRTSRWKYVEPSDGPEEYRWAPGSELGYKPFPQLFDLSADPREQQNVADDQPGTVQELEAILAAERAAGSTGRN